MKKGENRIYNASFKIISGTSFPQEAFYYYIKQIDSTAINRDLIGGEEVDIHLPSLHIGIEYDGIYFHSGSLARKKELKKNTILKEHGLTLIRVKEQDGDFDEVLFLEDEGVPTFTYSVGTYKKYLGKVIVAVISYIFGECSIYVDPLNKNHELAILESYRQNLADMSLETLYPEIAKEWHPTKNGLLKPVEFYPYSNYKVWWVCEKGHEWCAQINSRTQGCGCPICSGQKVLTGFNDLQTINPDLAKEWHPTKNGTLKPTEVMRGTQKKVWWVCEQGHEWQASIANRAKGRGCPYCSGHKVLVGFNDLQTINPDLAKEWHPTKNGELKPTDVTKYSDRKAWWICKHGHEWRATVSNRTQGSGCPICSGKKVLEGFNDLQTINPDLAREWHPTKNGVLKPTEVTKFSDRKVWWICKHGHEWEETINNRTRGSGCPYCSGHKVLLGFNDLQTLNPKLAREWHPTKNGDLKPTEVTLSSNKNIWWICKYGHEWKTTVAHRSDGTGCPYCSGKKVLAEFNDLQTTNPDLAREWHPTKNGDLKPTEVMSGTHKKVWWLCKQGHEWQASIANRAKGRGCPYCSCRAVLAGFNDLQTINPDLAKEWHPTKNGDLKPTNVTSYSNKKVWWLCKQGHEWEAVVSSRTMGCGCPICSGKKVLVGFNDLETLNPKLTSEWHPTKNEDLKPTDVTLYSNKKVWWVCEHGHEWQTTVANRAQGRGCPECRKLYRKKNTKG